MFVFQAPLRRPCPAWTGRWRRTTRWWSRLRTWLDRWVGFQGPPPSASLSLTSTTVRHASPTVSYSSCLCSCWLITTHQYVSIEVPTQPHTSSFRFFPRDIPGIRRGWRRHRTNQGRGSWCRTKRRDGVQHSGRSWHVQHHHGPKHTGGCHCNQKGLKKTELFTCFLLPLTLVDRRISGKDFQTLTFRDFYCR